MRRIFTHPEERARTQQSMPQRVEYERTPSFCHTTPAVSWLTARWIALSLVTSTMLRSTLTGLYRTQSNDGCYVRLAKGSRLTCWTDYGKHRLFAPRRLPASFYMRYLDRDWTNERPRAPCHVTLRSVATWPGARDGARLESCCGFSLYQVSYVILSSEMINTRLCL